MLCGTLIMCVLGLAQATMAHMVMVSPLPFGNDSLNNSPLDASGLDFPCKQRPNVYRVEGPVSELLLGSTHPLTFMGGATHGGGSCQISITYDREPTKSSVWKVIHSIEGGCPAQGIPGNAGNDPYAPGPTKYTFPIPSDLPTGIATLAWTWFNKIGNREMYMNCAPVEIKGASGFKRSARLQSRDQAAYSKLPNMFVANIAESDCITVEGKDLVFPDAGDSLELLGEGTDILGGPEGGSCGAVGSSSGSSSVSGSVFDWGAGLNVRLSSGVQGGSTSGSSSQSGASSITSSSADTVNTESDSPIAMPATMSDPESESSNDVPSNNVPSISSDVGVLSGACTSEGMWNCVSGSSFQQCGSGVWSVVRPLAGGTYCRAGETMDFTLEEHVEGDSVQVHA